MVQPIRIFLGDLTYNTVGMSTEVFPLNVGYIAAHCKKRFGSKIDITLFKYIDKLEKSIYENQDRRYLPKLSLEKDSELPEVQKAD